jgi:hypothetical protein
MHKFKYTVLWLGFTLAAIAPSFVYAQSKPAPWAATVKASVSKGANDGLDFVTYTYTFSNISGKPLSSEIKLGYQCDFLYTPLRGTGNNLAFPDEQALNTDYPRSFYDCVVHFGRALKGNDLPAFLLHGEAYTKRDFSVVEAKNLSRSENDNSLEPALRTLNPKGYKTSNGWLASTDYAVIEFGPGSSYYEINLTPAPDWMPADRRMPVPAGAGFTFSVIVSDKDPNWTKIHYIVETRDDGLEVGSSGTWPIKSSYRAYPITKADTIPPVITASLSTLPAKTGDNKDFVRVQLTASVKDNFDAGPEWSVSSVLRTDKPTVAGDVSKTADMVDNQWLLKVPVGETRKYVVNVRAEDATGNVSTQSVPIELTGKAIVVNPPPPKPQPKPRVICLWGNRFCFTVPERFGFWW